MKQKTTYLVQGNGIMVSVPKSEWKRIVEANRSRAKEDKRYFIEDRIYDSDSVDVMVYEVPYPEYLEWHRQAQAKSRSDDAAKQYSFISLNDLISDSVSLDCLVEDPKNPINEVISSMILDSLLAELKEWKPWASEMLCFFLAGKQQEAIRYFGRKYHISPQTVRKYRRQLSEYIQTFLLR